MTRLMLVDALHPEETRVVITSNGAVEEFDFITSAKSQIKGNIYLAKVTRVEPSLQAAFVEYGGGKQGFLSFTEVHPDYYQIPIADRKRILEEQYRANAEAEAEEEASDHRASARQEGEADPDPERPDISPENGEGSDGAPRRGRGRRRRKTIGPRAQEVRAAEVSTSSGPMPEEESPAEMSAAESAPADEGEPAEQPHSIETASDDEDIEQHRKSGFSRRYKIQEVVKRGQILLVQVIKEERGNKGVSLTTYISLAGRYCVLMPNSTKEGGISRKISKHEDRKRLRDIAKELKDARGMSAIIRTAGIDRTKAEVKRDYDYLIKLWNHIREDALAATAPALIYEENNILKRTVRDYYTPDIEHVYVQGEEAFKSMRDMMKMILPSHAARVKHFKETVPLLVHHDVESQLQAMYHPTARLRSGGYIVINHTEALISIDVNSGRSTTERNVEETALKTNLEAAAEIARQLRLRDLGGLIVVDFIDMFYGRNRRSVERAFKDALRSDRAKIQVGHISPFGLLELSRQRLRPSLGESTTVTCPHCNGTGFIRSLDSLAIEIVRNLEKEASTGQYQELRIVVHPDLALFMMNASRRYLTTIEETYGIAVSVKLDNARMPTDYVIDRVRRSGDQGDRQSRDGSRQRNGGGARNQRGRRPQQDERYQAGQAEYDRPLKEEPAMDAVTEEPVVEEDADSAERFQEGQEQRSERPQRRERGGRNRRGGERGGYRNRQDGGSRSEERAPRETGVSERTWQQPELKTQADMVQEARPRMPVEQAVAPERPQPTYSRPERVLVSAEDTEEPSGPPRKGWWKRMME